MGTIPVYLHFVSFIRSFFQNFFQSKDHEEPEDVRLFGDRNPRHFVRRRSGIETDGRRGNFVERGDGNRPTQRKRRGGIARGGNISQASQASINWLTKSLTTDAEKKTRRHRQRREHLFSSVSSVKNPAVWISQIGNVFQDHHYGHRQRREHLSSVSSVSQAIKERKRT